MKIFLSDTTGFDMNCHEIIQFCQEAWKGTYTSNEINRLDNEEKYFICEGKKNTKFQNFLLVQMDKGQLFAIESMFA